jgi:S-(hydroxymethyl)glutathione dehydrogenase / alcohol dehydrogenase
MKAAVVYEYGKPLVIEEINLDPPLKNEVKIKVAFTAICHSDIHDIKGELPAKLPFVAGHEVAGYVDTAGEGVTAFKSGDPVLVTLLRYCGKCYFCQTGMPHLCEFRWPMGETHLTNKKGVKLSPSGRIGGFAEYVVVHESQLIKVPANMPLDRAALVACGVITGFGVVVNRAQVKPLHSVVVMGVGGVGMNAIQGAALCGARPIIAVDVVDSKLQAALKFGATHTVNAKNDDAVEAVKKLTSGRGAESTFVTVGSVAALKQGFQMTGPRGTAYVVGLPPVKDVFSIMPMEFVRFEKSISGGFMGSTNPPVDIPKLIALYQEGTLKLDELISGHYPLERINQAIESSEKGADLRNVISF